MRFTKPRSAILFVLLCAMGTAGAQDAPGIDPKVRQVLDAVGTFYKGVDTATFVYAIDVTRDVSGKKDSNKLDFSVAMERPNKISFAQGESAGGVDVVSDGKTMAVSIPQLKKYVMEDAPATIADALEWGALSTLTEFNSIIGELTGPDPAAAILDGVQEAKYIGEEDVEGQKYHRVRFVQEDMDVDMWIASGPKPFLARMSPDVSKAINNPDVKLTLDITFSDWSVNAAIPPERFAFKAAADAVKAESFEALFGSEETFPAEGLVGKPAPAFTLKDADDKPIDLSAYLGKNVVVLDFWATWCPPCVKSLPILAEVTGSFADQGVVFIAVNQGEGPEEVAAFLKEYKLSPTVAFDSETAVGQQYLISGLPLSVLIGKSGTVEAVHIGASPVLRQQLRNQLTALVSGRSLIKKDG